MTDRTLSDDQVRLLAHRLIGTVDTIPGVLQARPEDFGGVSEEDQLGLEDLRYLDSMCFVCEVCGWWCAEEELCSSGAELTCEECDGG